MIFFGTQDALALHLAEFVGEGAAVDPQIICQLLAVKGDVELVVALFLCKKRQIACRGWSWARCGGCGGTYAGSFVRKWQADCLRGRGGCSRTSDRDLG